MGRLVIPAKTESISRALDFLEEELSKEKVSRKEINEAMLLSEESMVQLLENATGGNLHISVRRAFGCRKIKISALGKEFVPGTMALDIDIDEAETGRETEAAIRNLLMQSFANKVKYVNHDGCNFMEIVVGIPERAITWVTGIVFLSAIAVGLLLKFCLPLLTVQMIDHYLLFPIETIFLNALKLTIAPMVFFSILTNVAKYASFSGSGRISVKVIVSCVVTSVIAVCVGYFTFRLLDPGTVGELSKMVERSGVNNTFEITGANDVMNTIVNIVPSNIIDPFSKMDTLQLIFLSLVCGIALGQAGGYSKTLRTSAQALETLCNKIVEIISRMIPFVAFFSTISMIFNTEVRTLLSIAELCLTLAAALFIMLLIYCLMVLCIGRVNPLKMIKKYFPLMRQTFFAGSASAVMPKTISFCKNKLGVSGKVCSFSIPFGAIANMDGTSIYITIATLFIAKLCGIELFGSGAISLVLSVMILSVGAPLSSGTVIIIMSMLFTQIGASMTAVSLFLGLNALIEMVLAMSDTIGDVAISVAIARTEKMLNTKIYNA